MTDKNPRWFPDHRRVGGKPPSAAHPLKAPIGTHWVAGVRILFDNFPERVDRKLVVGLHAGDGKIYLHDGEILKEDDPELVVKLFTVPTECPSELGTGALRNFRKHNPQP